MTLLTPRDAPARPSLSPDPGSAADRSASLVDQLVQWAEHRIQEHVFRAGMRLPSVRQLATDRGVSRFTVVQAYERLVVRGHVQARRGAGFFVREPTASPARRAKAVPARSQTIDMGWLIRNMQSGIAADMSPGFGYLPPGLCGSDLIKAGLRSVAATARKALNSEAEKHACASMVTSSTACRTSMSIPISPAWLIPSSAQSSRRLRLK